MLGALVAPTAIATVNAEEPPLLDTLDVSATGIRQEREVMMRDSDGDGWSDWYERLEGTDPYDPSSHPHAATLQIVDHTIFVQSLAFPDRLVMIGDPELPDRVDSLADLFARIDGITANTGVGAFFAEIESQINDIPGSDMLTAALADVEAMTGSKRPPVSPQVGGQSVDQIGFDVSTTSSGGVVVTTTDKGGWTVYTVEKSGVGVHDAREYLNADGSGVRVHSWFKDGKKTGGDITILGKGGDPVHTTNLDASGKPTGTIVYPTTVAPGGTTATTTPTNTTPSTTATTTPSSSPNTTSAPNSSTPSTTEGGYRDPEHTPVRMPTPDEVAERAEFLRGLNTRFGPAVVPTDEPPKERPVVADPAEPPCDHQMCAAFVIVEAPDLSRMKGGCPPLYCNSAGPIQVPIPK